MSQNQRTLQPTLSNRWQGLPIQVKLLVPILLVLIVVMLVVVRGIQSPLHDLTASPARDAFGVQSDLYQERLATFLTQQQKNVSDLVNGSLVQAYGFALTSNDPTTITAARKAAEFTLQSKIIGGIAPYEKLQLFDQSGTPVSTIVLVREGNALSSKLLAVNNVSAAETAYLRSVMTNPPDKGYVTTAESLQPLSNGKPGLLLQIGMPIYKNNAPVGALVASFNADDIFRTIFQSSKARSLQSFIVHRLANIVAGSGTSPPNSDLVIWLAR